MLIAANRRCKWMNKKKKGKTLLCLLLGLDSFMTFKKHRHVASLWNRLRKLCLCVWSEILKNDWVGRLDYPQACMDSSPHYIPWIMCKVPVRYWSILPMFNTLRPRQNGRYFADNIFKCIFLNEQIYASIKVSLTIKPKGPINNIPALVQIMAWWQQAIIWTSDGLVYWRINSSLSASTS